MRIYYQISLYCRKQVFFSSQKHGGFQSPKFPSVKPEVSFCQTRSFYLSKCFFLSNPVFLSSQKFSPVNSESCSCLTRSFLMSNSKLPPFESRLSVKSKVSFLQFGNFFLTNLNFSHINPDVSVRPFNN